MLRHIAFFQNQVFCLLHPRYNRLSIRQALRIRKSSYMDLKNNLDEVGHVQISLWTVRRRLFAAIKRSHCPAHGPKWLRKHRTARLSFARNCTYDMDSRKMDRLLFSDDVRISLHREGQRWWVLRKREEWYAEAWFKLAHLIVRTR